MKIALAQIDILPKHLQSNFENIVRIYKSLKDSADIIVFPELALSGYYVGDAWEQNAFLRECESLGQELAKLTKESVLIFGNIAIDWKQQNEDGRVRKYNAAFCAQNGKFLSNPKLKENYWIKSLSPNYRMFDESRHFYDLRKRAQDLEQNVQSFFEPLRISLSSKTYKIGISICEDAWDENYTVSPIRELCKQGSDFILNLSSSPYTFAKNSKRKRVFQQLADETQVPIFYVNCIGTQNLGKTIYTFDGASSVYKAQTPSHVAPSFQEYTLVYDIETHTCVHHVNKVLSETQELYEALLFGIRSLLQKWNLKRIVIGVSGGIDSALAAALYTEVLGKDSVFLVNMPTQFNSEVTKDAAKQLALNLDCPYASIPIQQSFNDTVSQLSQVRFSEGTQVIFDALALENIQARDRSSRVLSAVAASLKGVFACNANKTELCVGYCTLYGDAGGFLAVLGDLWKNQIYKLAEYVNSRAGRNLIPLTSLQIVPSAELSDKQDVNKGLGDPLIYAYHDALFKSWVEDWERKNPEDILQAVLDKKLETLLALSEKQVLGYFKNDLHAFVKDLEHWWFAYTGMGAFKRVQSPPILAVSRRAFGNDYRESIGTTPLSRKYYEIKTKLLSSQ